MQKTDFAQSTPIRPSARDPEDLGHALKTLRRNHGKTLAEAAALCSVSAATLSRIENGQLSPTYDVISRICSGFGISIRDLIALGSPGQPPRGWTSLTLRGAGRVVETPHYRYEILCDDVQDKAFMVFRTELLCASIDAFGPLMAHPGHEQLIVEAGQVEVWIEGFEPRILSIGDSMALDSTLPHAVIRKGPGPAMVLWVVDTEAAGA